jgi:hypothetical protein
MTIADAAAFLAQQWPCFPCDARKRPITPRGFYDATSHPAAVRAMFQSPDAALIGVPMGPASGLLCLDVDYGKGGMEWLEANADRLPETRTHRTMNGGRHLFFKWPKGRNLRNRASKWAAGVDIRAEGGYAIMPPSPGYDIVDASMPADAPAWLLDLIDPPAHVQVAQTYTPPSTRIPDRYAEAALDGECRAVASQQEGGRNDRLNVAAVKLGTLVATGALSESVVRSELRRAALHAGLDPRETDLTIASGLAYGLTQPRELPQRVAPLGAPASRVAPSVPVAASGQPTDNPTQLTDGGTPRHLPLVYWNDIRPAIAGSDFVEGLLIEGAMTVVYGPSNCGKTFFCTDLAIHVATGRKWRGREIDPGGVIYCALEGAHGISNRVAAFRKRHGLEGVEVPFAIIPVTLDLLDPAADTQRLIDAIQAARHEMGCAVKLVVLDTLSRAMAGGNENSPEDMGSLVTNGDRIRQQTGAHVLWVHHSGKDQAQGARGHSLLRAATDTEIEISRPDKDSPSTAKVTKQRELEIDGAWTFTLESVELGTDRRGKPVTSCVVIEAEPEENHTSRLSPSGRDALKSLHETLIKTGQRNRHPDVPASARVVRLEAWRIEFYTRSHLDNQDARKKAFQRGVKDLRDAGVVGVLHDLAWLTEGLSDE